MRSAKNFSPEWGYLAPAPSLARTARVVLVATAIGATAGAGVVLSLVERPAEAQKMPIAARAIVTSVRETAVPSATPTVSTAALSSPAIAVSAVPASAPIAASAPPPAPKPSAARTAARAMPRAANPPPAAPPSTVATATPALVPTASAAPAPSAPAPLSAGNSTPTPAASATSANANVSVAAASSSATTAAIGPSVAPQAADAAPASEPESPSIIAPETLSPKKAKRHASSKAAPGLGSILRRLFVAHSGRSYYPHSANGGL
jgi:hypothetical protein